MEKMIEQFNKEAVPDTDTNSQSLCPLCLKTYSAGHNCFKFKDMLIYWEFK